VRCRCRVRQVRFGHRTRLPRRRDRWCNRWRSQALDWWFDRQLNRVLDRWFDRWLNRVLDRWREGNRKSEHLPLDLVSQRSTKIGRYLAAPIVLIEQRQRFPGTLRGCFTQHQQLVFECVSLDRAAHEIIEFLLQVVAHAKCRITTPQAHRAAENAVSAGLLELCKPATGLDGGYTVRYRTDLAAVRNAGSVKCPKMAQN
jgi:hypothetical protein